MKKTPIFDCSPRAATMGPHSRFWNSAADDYLSQTVQSPRICWPAQFRAILLRAKQPWPHAAACPTNWGVGADRAQTPEAYVRVADVPVAVTGAEISRCWNC